MTIQGFVDEISQDRVAGWAWDPAQPNIAVILTITVDDHVVARVAANAFRTDLEAAGIGNGQHSFVIDGSELHLPLTTSMISVQVEATGEHLTHSPARLEGPLELNRPAKDAMAALLQSPGSDQALRERAEFLAGHVDRLLARLSDRQANRPDRSRARGLKWREVDPDRPAPAPLPPPTLPPRALVVDATMPAPNRDAGSHAILSHMQSLQRLGFQVTIAAADMSVSQHPDTFSALGIGVAGSPWFASVEEVLRRQAGEWDLIYLHRVDTASRYVPLAKHYAPRARLIFSVADLHSLRLFRQAGVEDRPELVPHANYIRNQELAAAASCHAVVSHSTAEIALLQQWLPQVNGYVVPWVFPVHPTSTPFAERHGVAFIGSFGHEPNLDAALWLMEEIMPLVWQSDPTLTCFVAGSAMPKAVSRKRDPRIRTLGRIDDLRTLLDQVRMTVAPLAYGAGLKGKVGDSLAAGVPCICTPFAAEGYELPEPLLGMIAADTASIAASIVRLHSNQELFDQCRAAGLAYIGEAFSEAKIDAAMRVAAGLPPATPQATSNYINAALKPERDAGSDTPAPRQTSAHPAGKRSRHRPGVGTGFTA